MTPKYFLDSSAIYTLANKADPVGTKISDILTQTRPMLITTDSVFAETLSLITKRIGKQAAITTGLMLKTSKYIKIMRLEKSVLKKAWEMFAKAKYEDKDFDYIDAMSFACCRQQKIKTVLTLDHHFTQMGFAILP